MSTIFSTFFRKNFRKIVKLSDGEVGKRYKILSDALKPSVKVRFAEMGLTENAIVTVLKKAPLGDPMEISVRDYRLCIRTCEAEKIKIAEIDDDD